jgi:hypothetical protein
MEDGELGARPGYVGQPHAERPHACRPRRGEHGPGRTRGDDGKAEFRDEPAVTAQPVAQEAPAEQEVKRVGRRQTQGSDRHEGDQVHVAGDNHEEHRSGRQSKQQEGMVGEQPGSERRAAR